MKIAVFFIFAAIAFNSSCSETLGTSKTKSSNDGKNATVEDGKDTVLSVNAGSLSGANVTVPTGALETGSVLNINSADSPDSFQGHGGVSSASDPMSVTATGPSGEELTELTSPMTLQLPLGNALRLADVEQTAENICVFLNSVAGDFFVWRRDTVAIEDSFVKFESTRFGVYQLFYCGQEELSASKEAKDENIAGSASTAIVNLTIPSTYLTSTSSVCVGLVGGLSNNGKIASTDDFKIYAQNSFTTSSSEDASIELFGTPGSGLLSLDDASELHFVVSFQSSDNNGCLDAPESTGRIANYFEGERQYGFKKAASTFKGGGLNETLGAGEFDIGTGSTKIDSPSGATSAVDADGCLVISTDGDAEGGFTHTRIKLDSSGQVNSETTMSHHYVTSSKSENTTTAYLNTTECLNETVDNATGTSSKGSQAYLNIWRDIDLSGTIAFVATAFSLKTNSILALATENACFQVFETSVGNTMTWSTEERAAERVFEYVSAFSDSPVNHVFYLPKNDDEEYDAFVKPLTADESCSSNKDGYAEENYDYSAFGSMFINPS